MRKEGEKKNELEVNPKFYHVKAQMLPSRSSFLQIVLNTCGDSPFKLAFHTRVLGRQQMHFFHSFTMCIIIQVIDVLCRKRGKITQLEKITKKERKFKSHINPFPITQAPLEFKSFSRH